MAATRSWNSAGIAAQSVPLRAVLLRLALFSLVACCLVCAVRTVRDSARLISNQFDNTYPESSQLYVAVAGASTGHIYFPLYSSPYVVQPYGPLFYVFNIAVARAAHLSLDATHAALRILTFAEFLLCGLVAFLLLLKMKLPAWMAALSGVALLAQPYFFAWNVTVRPDMLCLLLMLVSLYFAVGEDPSAAACAASGFVGGLAFLVKQPGLAAPLAIGVVFLLRCEIRRALILAAAAALPVVAVFADLLLRREPFLDQFTSVGKNLWSLSNGYAFLAGTADIRVLISLAIGAVALPLAFRAGRAAQILAVFALACLLLNSFGVPQVGADTNYYLPPLAACALLLPFCIREFETRWSHPLLCGVAVAALLGSLYVGVTRRNQLPVLPMSWRAHPYASLQPFRVLSDRPSFTVHGRDPQLLDPFTIRGLEVAGHWSSAPIVAALRQQDYDLIVFACMGSSRGVCSFRRLAYFSREVVQAINENYVVYCLSPAGSVFAPRSRQIDIDPAGLSLALGQPCSVALQGKPARVLFPLKAR